MSAQDSPASRGLDLTTLRGAAIAVLALRVVYGVALFVAHLLNEEPPPKPVVHDLPEGAGVFETVWFVVVNPWLRRDATYYWHIATDGYAAEAGTTAFHPLYPFSSRLLALGADASVGMMIVSTLAAIALVVVFARYVRDVHGPQWAQPAAWALVAVPGGIVWFLLYTEGLFAVLVVGTLWMLHRKNWWSAGAFAAFATLTRQQGVVLLAPMVFVLWKHRREAGPHTLSIVLVPAAYAAFAAYRIFVLGDAPAGDGAFSQVQGFLVSSAAADIAPGQRIAWPWEPLVAHISRFAEDPGRLHLLLDFVLGGGLIAILVAGARHLTRPEQLYCAGVVLVTLCYFNGEYAPYMALPRHVIIAVPVAYLIARFVRDQRGRWLLGVGIVFNVLLVLLYGMLKWIP